MKVEFYKNKDGKCPVQDGIKDLANKSKRKVLKFLERIEDDDDNKLGRFFRSQNALPIKGYKGLFEFRPFPCRIFFTFKGGACWLLHLIVKKNNGRTPKKELKKANKIKEIIK